MAEAAGADLGAWQPFTTSEVRSLLDGAPFRWWFTGGHALELFVGESWRSHDDIDIGIVRADAGRLHAWLDGVEVVVAAGGVLHPWSGRPLDEARSENNLWCRRVGEQAWRLDVVIGSGTPTEWVYRRDPTVRRAWDAAVLTDPFSTHRYLAPELQLLFKSKDVRPKDTIDAEHVIPHLDPASAGWLAVRLGREHPWTAMALARSRHG